MLPGLLGVQLLLGLGVLLQLNDFSKVVGAASLALVATYPLMKRITFWVSKLTLHACKYDSWGLLLNWPLVMFHHTVTCRVWSSIMPDIATPCLAVDSS